MSGAPKLSSMNVQRSLRARKLRSSTKEVEVVEDKNGLAPSISLNDLSSPLDSASFPSILRRQDSLLHSNLSLSASCSSDASSDSFRSRASTGRIYRTRITANRKKLLSSKAKAVGSKGASESPSEGSLPKKTCGWVTPTTDPSYAAFHDEEWGIPQHNDKKLFELLVLCSALSELTWPCILSKRHTFREVFADFDPTAVASLNEKKITAPGSAANSLLSELRLRAVLENARQVSKLIDEFGSFDKYIWSFMNHKPLVSRFRYPRQIPVKTPKADVISKDLVRRGFRCVGPTVVYSFMQVAGLTNDHLVGCFRFQDCITASEGIGEAANATGDNNARENKANDDDADSKICRSLHELSI